MKHPAPILICLAAMLLTASVSCGGTQPAGGTQPENQNTSEPSSAAEREVQTEAETADPFDTGLTGLDFGGKEFRIITHDVSWLYAVVDTDAETGDTLNDAIYRRNRAAEQKLNFIVREDARTNDIDGIVRTSVQAGDNAYELAAILDRTALVFAQEGLVLPITNLPYIDLSKPWWSQSLNAALSIANQMYFAYSDFNLTPYDYSYAMVFHKAMAESYDIPDLYETVRSGKWTFDRFEEYTKTVVSDLDGNSVMDDTDQWGYVSADRFVLPCFWISAGELSIDKDANDIPAFTLIGDERFAEVIARIFEMTRGNKIYSGTAEFTDGHTLFASASFNSVASMRDMEAEFGIIPFPKWDEDQKDYYSRVEGGEMQLVPPTVDDLEFVGAAFEELNAQSRKFVIPAYYDVTLKTKAARDEDSSEMLDLIFANRIYDLGDTYWCNTLRDGIFNQMFSKDNRDLASGLAKTESKINKEISAAVEAFASIS